MMNTSFSALRKPTVQSSCACERRPARSPFLNGLWSSLHSSGLSLTRNTVQSPVHTANASAHSENRKA